MLKYGKNFQNKNLKSCHNETRNKIKKEQAKRKIGRKRKKRCRMHHHNIGARKHAHGTFLQLNTYVGKNAKAIQ